MSTRDNILNLPNYKRVDLQITKNIFFNFGTYFKITVSILNLFNSENIVDVYPTSGTAEETGFLNSEQGMKYFSALSQDQKNMYITREMDFRKYGAPRQVRLVFTLGFK